MKKNFRFAVAALLGILVLQPGCLLSHSNHRVLRQGEALQPLTFESPASQQKFETLAQAEINNKGNESSSSFTIPFVVGLARSTRVSENAIRNDFATKIDVNGDRHISDFEVQTN